MIVQIYEAGSATEAEALIGAGVDHVGVLVGQGEFPREMPTAQAVSIFQRLPRGMTRLALSLSGDPSELERVVRETRANLLHVGAALERVSPADIKVLKRLFPETQIMRSIPVTGEESVAWAQAYDRVADWLLLDSHRPGDTQIGALGVTHDWSVSARIVATVERPVVLAGGLGPHNVAEAIEAVRPYGVDSKTKTDREDGAGKDLARVKDFVQIAKRFSNLPR